MAKVSSPKKNKHLTAEDRKEIEECLRKRMTFKAIGKLIGKDPTTISYEIKHHREAHRNGFSTSDEECPRLLKAPFVCNGCGKRHNGACRCVRYLYRATAAQDEYRKLLTEAREGTPLNKEAFYQTDRILSEGLQKGQHIYHIMANAKDIACSKSTVYRHFKKGYYSASIVQLPRAVKFKPHKQRKQDTIPKGLKRERTYDDFLFYLEEHHLQRHTELDTVIGRIGGKVILTIHFTACNFMIGLLLDDKSSLQAASKFQALKAKLKERGISARTTFDVLLADNGGEFADVFSFEEKEEGLEPLKMFFCDPMMPSQKPRIEKNHTLLRDILPKGSSFDDLTQDTVNLIFSHVNAVSRSVYGGKSAYDMFSFIYSKDLATALGIAYVAPADVVQSPRLLRGIADLKKGL